jgi:hypothetical protein
LWVTALPSLTAERIDVYGRGNRWETLSTLIF